MNIKTFWFLVAVTLLVYLLHRLALWLEAQGWLYYINQRPKRPSISSALLEIQTFVEPQKRELLEIRHEEEKQMEEGESGEPLSDPVGRVNENASP